MEKNQLLKDNGCIYRVLATEEDSVLMIDCLKKTMPNWHSLGEISGYEDCTEEELLEVTGTVLMEEENCLPRLVKLHMRGLQWLQVYFLSLQMTGFVQRQLGKLQKKKGFLYKQLGLICASILLFRIYQFLYLRKDVSQIKNLQRMKRTFGGH